MPQPQTPEEWAEFFQREEYQEMLPQQQIRVFNKVARRDPRMKDMSDGALLKMRNRFQGDAQKVLQARKLGPVGVEPHEWTRGEKREDIRLQSRETAHPGDLYRSTVSHTVGRLPFGVGARGQDFLESAAEALIRGLGSQTVRTTGTVAEGLQQKDVSDWREPEGPVMEVDPIKRALEIRRRRDRDATLREENAEVLDARGREAARPFMETAEEIDSFASRFGKQERTSFNELKAKAKDGDWRAALAGSPELVAQTLGDVAGYAIPYIYGPGKYRSIMLASMGTGEVSQEAWEQTGSTQPQYSIPAGVVIGALERAFGPEAWSRAVRKTVGDRGNKFVATFLKDPKRAKGLATSILTNFFKYGTPEAVTEGVQEYIVTQAQHADDPALTLDTWNTLPQEDRDQITEAFGATLLTLGLVGTVKGRRSQVREDRTIDAGPAPTAPEQVFIEEPKTPDQMAAEQQTLAPIAARYNELEAQAVDDPQSQQMFAEGAESVRVVTPADRFTNAAADLARRVGLDVTFFTDSLGRDPDTGRTAPGVRGVVVDNDNGSILVRVDPNNPRASAGHVVKSMLTQLALDDPPRLRAAADYIETNHPNLWKAAVAKAQEQNIDDRLGILAIAAEMSAPDIITAYTAPEATAEAAQGYADDNEIFSMQAIRERVSKYGRWAIENMINPRLVNDFGPGSLRYALRNSNDVPLTARDVKGKQDLAKVAQYFTEQIFPDGSHRVRLSTSDRQPVIFERNVEGGTLDPDIGPVYTTERGTLWSQWVDRMFQKWMEPRVQVKEGERQVKELSLPLTDDVAVSQAIDTQQSVVAEKARKIEQENLTRLGDILRSLVPSKDFKKEFDALGDYLIAVTAIERNAYLQRQGMPPDSSGMSDEDANNIIAKVAANNRTAIYDQALAAALEVPNTTLREMLESGLISPEQYQDLRAAHPRYLPMKSEHLQEVMGKDERLTKDETGKAIDVTTDGLVRQLIGRTGKRDIVHPIRQLMVDSLLRLDMAERNRTMQTVYRYAQKFGGKDIVARVGRVSQKSDARNRQISVYFNGIPHVIEFKSQGMRDQFANLSNKKLHYAFQAVGKLTNLKARAATTFSIPFWFVNFPRDLVTSYFQSDSHEMGIQTLKNAPSALKAIISVEFPMFAAANPSPETQHQIDRYKLYRESGGQLSFMGLREMYRDLNKLVHQLGDDKTGVMYRMRQFVDLMDNMSSVLENTTRLAAFNAAVDDGATPKAGAHYARNITVDFDKKTDSARKLNTIYVFANANLQGTARIMRAMWKNPHGRKTLMQFSMYGFMAAMLSRITAPEEWEKISEDEKSRNLIFLNPDGTYNKIPLPPGLAFFFRMGAFMEEIAFDDKPKSKMETFLTPFSMVLDEFSPVAPSRINGSGIGGNLYSFVRPFLPTGLQEATDISVNSSVWGQEIFPEAGKYMQWAPRNEQMFGDEKSTLQRRLFRPFTKWLNEDVGGGNEYWAGTWGDLNDPGAEARTDYSPEVFEYLMESYLSGPMAFTNRSFKMAQHYMNVARDKEVPPLHENMIPIVRRFHSRATDYEIGDEYYSIRDKVQQAKNVEAAYENDELSEEDFNKWQAKHGWILDMQDTFDATEEELTDIRQNRTESTYRVDAKRRMELQRTAVEEFYDLWANEKGDKKVVSTSDTAEEPPQRYYDETAVRVATDQMGMLTEMIRGRDSGTLAPEAANKYMAAREWMMPVLEPYRKWLKMSMNPPEGMSPGAMKIIEKRFMDAYYDAEVAHSKKPPAEAGGGVSP